MILRFSLALLTICLVNNAALAEQAAQRTIRVEGRQAITVNKPVITLSDLATISSTRSEDDDAIIALQKIEIEASPAAGKETTISASRILEKLKSNGVDSNQLVYVLPRILKVSRASRSIALPEIESAIKESLRIDNREVAIKRINYSDEVQVPPSAQNLTATSFQSPKAGQIGFTIRAQVPGEEDVTFDVAAQVDEWIEIPTARRPINRGTTIGSNDVVMARLNIASLPQDILQRAEDVVGQEANSELQPGEAFRRNRLSTPPVVAAGSRVVMIYKAGLLEATATGTAMEAGMVGQEIRIKNEVSKKIVSGRVLEAGKVGVNQ